MFRLKTTFVAMSLMRPWRTGWSVERGVDFSVCATTRPVTAPPTARADEAAAERVCFVDEDRMAPTFVGPDAAPETGSGEAPPVRAWWSLAGKPSRT